KYPDRYSLKSDSDRIEEASALAELMFKIPSLTIKKELAKQACTALLSGKTTVAQLQKIYKEVDDAPYATSDPAIIQMAKEQGLAGSESLSLALGFAPGES